MSRRRFFKLLADSVARAAAEFTYEVSKPNKEFIRPPGSLDEDTFVSLCDKCGKCVEACQTGVLDKVKGMNPIVLDTPFMNFENNFCEMCYSCINVCPSGALKKENLQKFKYVARLDKSKCVAFQSVFCQTCYWSCPQMDKAITLIDFTHPEFHEEHCLGCGRCIHACPTTPKSIKLVKVKIDEGS
ncbi:4Fe-4S dicluster domain-containing protein [Desulfurobacterium thermolithotrophum]|uniref:4Fe-4S dicluster domain-containing protein n=1 Tax=Desulfurobacterium thermolithotrophum TaxID=64160 RepID=UPI0013D8A0DD|nr:4Fe-4S dicluster domain-containing protein [Desulfurobacterium thermolithotrophum]